MAEANTRTPCSQLFITEQSLNMIVVDAHTYNKAPNKCEAFKRLVGFYLDNQCACSIAIRRQFASLLWHKQIELALHKASY